MYTKFKKDIYIGKIKINPQSRISISIGVLVLAYNFKINEDKFSE